MERQSKNKYNDDDVKNLHDKIAGLNFFCLKSDENYLSKDIEFFVNLNKGLNLN
jgi:hypothetical protein